MLTGQRPDITPAQIAGMVPVVAKLLFAFGIYHLTKVQIDALTDAVTAGLALMGADALIRIGRNHGLAKQNALQVPIDPGDVDGGPLVDAAMTDDEIEQSVALENQEDESEAAPTAPVIRPPGPPTPPIPPSDQPVG